MNNEQKISMQSEIICNKMQKDIKELTKFLNHYSSQLILNQCDTLKIDIIKELTRAHIKEFEFNFLAAIDRIESIKKEFGESND